MAGQAIDVAERRDDVLRFSLTPYFVLPIATTGEATISGVSADVDLSGSDVFGALNLGGSLRAELASGEFSLIVDGFFVSLGGDATAPLPGPLPGTAAADLSFKQGWVAVIGTYRVLDGAFDTPGTLGRFALDAGVGVRWNALEQELKAAVDIGIGPGVQRVLGGTETWVEPTLLLRGGIELDDRWTVGGRAEIGGFGVGADNLQWNVLIGANYRAWENTSLRIGWQFYGIDYSAARSDGRFAYDVFQTGPYVAAQLRF